MINKFLFPKAAWFLLIGLGLWRLGYSQDKSKLIQLVKRKFQLMSRHELDAAASMYSDSARIASLGYREIQIGPAGFKSVYSRYFTGSPDLSYTITRIIPSKHTVTVEYTSTGTIRHVEQQASDYMIGKTYSLKNCSILDFRNGKIVSEMTYFDQVSFLTQVGFFGQHR